MEKINRTKVDVFACKVDEGKGLYYGYVYRGVGMQANTHVSIKRNKSDKETTFYCDGHKIRKLSEMDIGEQARSTASSEGLGVKVFGKDSKLLGLYIKEQTISRANSFILTEVQDTPKGLTSREVKCSAFLMFDNPQEEVDMLESINTFLTAQLQAAEAISNEKEKERLVQEEIKKGEDENKLRQSRFFGLN